MRVVGQRFKFCRLGMFLRPVRIGCISLVGVHSDLLKSKRVYSLRMSG